jgi:lauroyl/myristoyl acyltransferase
LGHNADVNRLKYLAYLLAAGAVQRVPLPLAYRIAAFAGTVAFYITPARRRVVVSNLAHVLPNADVHTLTRTAGSIYRSVALYYVDLLSIPRLNVGALRRTRVREHGYGHLADALAAGRGVIIATVHYGCPEVALQAARAWGIEILVLTEPIEPPDLSALFDRLRASHGHSFVTAGLAGGKQALRVLRRGGAVLLAVDRDIQGHGVEVPFFDALAVMPVGAIELARRTGAAIVPAISHRQADGSAIVTIQRPVELNETGDRHADTVVNVRRVLERFEDPVRADPGQWLVLEPLWPPRHAPR